MCFIGQEQLEEIAREREYRTRQSTSQQGGQVVMVRSDEQPSGYEPSGEEQTITAHFSAPGLKTAAIEIIRAFHPESVREFLENREDWSTGILATTATLVSPTPCVLHSSSLSNICFLSLARSRHDSARCRISKYFRDC